MSVLRALVVARSSGRVGVRPVWKATQPGGGRTAPILKTFVLLDNPSSIILTKTKGGLENTAQGSLDNFFIIRATISEKLAKIAVYIVWPTKPFRIDSFPERKQGAPKRWAIYQTFRSFPTAPLHLRAGHS